LQTPLTISVIVPAHNAERFLPRCLDALRASTRPAHEIIVVDDVSTDGTPRIAAERGARVLRMERQSGPGGARNRAAAEATGDVLLFIDSDVVARPDTLARVAATFEAQPDLAALFGSYDDAPAEPSFVSQYKNLQHHFVHQQGSPEANTFWAGCGAIRRGVFLEVGGFDLEKYPVPSIEDIELGYRLRERGHRILLDKDLQVKHLKRWFFWPLLRTEIVCRAAPWSRLILECRRTALDLNLKVADRVSSVLAGLLVILPLGALLWPPALALWLACLLLVVVLNRAFYGFFLRRRGLLFTLRVIPVHLLYYLYSAGTFTVCWLQHKLAAARS